jgi:multidrug efflux pump subunit AcrA (membrane-fusion protein)
MKRTALLLGTTVVLALAWTGCGGGGDSEKNGSVEKNPPPAATHGFKEGTGVFINNETRTMLGVQTAQPLKKTFPQRIETLARVYGAGKATALLDSGSASTITRGSPVKMAPAKHPAITGLVARIDRQMEKSLGQAEALIEFDAAACPLKAGELIPLTFETGQSSAELVVPPSSLLRTGEGNFVFVANGEYFLRTRVQLGAQYDGWMQITDGLAAGQVIATNGIQALWCIELQATKAGAACCPVDH